MQVHYIYQHERVNVCLIAVCDLLRARLAETDRAALLHSWLLQWIQQAVNL